MLHKVLGGSSLAGFRAGGLKWNAIPIPSLEHNRSIGAETTIKRRASTVYFQLF